MPPKRTHEDNLPSSPVMPPSSPFGDVEEVGFNENDEAIQEDIDDIDELAEEEAGEDLFGDNMEADYRRQGENDTYDGVGIDDDGDYDEMDAADRRRIDERLNRRDAALGGRSRGALGDAFMDGDDDSVSEIPTSLRRRHRYEEMVEDDPLTEEMSLEQLADIKASTIAKWVQVPAVDRGIASQFRQFLLTFTDEKGRSVYGSRIRVLGQDNAESLEVSLVHLMEAKGILAWFVCFAPSEVLPIFDRVAMDCVELQYPDYALIHAEIHVRLTDHASSTKLRDLRETNMGHLVKVSGVVTRRTGVFPQLKLVHFDCVKCKTVLGPYAQESHQELKLSFCHNCQSKGPFTVNSEKTLYRNFQKMTLQESPGSVPPGRLPRHKEVILLWDLIDTAKPGEDVEVIGTYKNSYDGGLNAKNGFPVFATVIEANSVKVTREQHAIHDMDAIRLLARDKKVVNRIISSIAPSIYGHRDVKTAIACSLFGGVAKDVNGKHSIRGDINVLLLGDPGVAKSQILKYVEKTAFRSVFSTGQGASAVGLTASVHRDPITQEWTLEGGALVLADTGTCLIDEFDKMNDSDRTSIHEAMEQQSISISKAGIVTSLKARCAVIAAANPVEGRYNSSLTFSQNVNLTEPILSRFDVLCVVRDTVDAEQDAMLADFVCASHTRSHPQAGTAQIPAAEEMTNIDGYDIIEQDLLRAYIGYARTIRPKLYHVDQDKIARVYADMRRESLQTGSFPITVRHLESIIRLSESFARMRLSEFVAKGDINRAIRVTVDSFIGAQKAGQRGALRRAFLKYTI